jgi:hypothetical protein
VDTRNPNGTFGGPPIAAQTSRDFPLQSTTACSIPSTAQAYSLNITAVPSDSTAGYLSAWPTGQTQPTVSTVNYANQVVVANGANVQAGTPNGSVSIYANSACNVIIDINGYYEGTPGVVDASLLYPNYSVGGFNDLGAAINAAIAMLPVSALSTHAGLVTIGAGIFYSSTTVVRPQQVTIRGSGNGTLIVFLPTSGLFAIDGDTTASAGRGGWQEMRIQGPNNTHTADCFFLGGDPAGVISPAGNLAPFTRLENVEIGYFRNAIRIGNHVWNLDCSHISIHDNLVGAQIESGATDVGEVLSFTNASDIYANSNYALYAPGGSFPYYGWTLIGSAVDYNGNGTQAPIVGSIRSTCCHFEQDHGPIWDVSAGGQIIDFGSSIVYKNSSASIASFNSSSLSSFTGTIGLALPGATVTAWNATSVTNYCAERFTNMSPGQFPNPATCP